MQLRRPSTPAVLAAVAALCIAAPAMAHGPTRQKVIETIEVDAPIDKVWEVIGNFQDMTWHPAVTKTEGEGGNDVNATRTLTLESGGIIKEKLNAYDADKKKIKYEITEVDLKVLPVTTYESWITLTPDGDETEIEWKGKFYRGDPNNNPPPELSDEAGIEAVTGIYKSGLEALKKKVEGD